MAGLSCARPLAPRRASLAPRHATVAPPRSQSVSPRRLAVSASAPGPGGDAESRPDVAPPMAVTRRAAALAGFALVASAAFNPAATAIPVAPLGKPGVYSTEAKALGLSDWALAHVLSMDLRLRRALINPAGCVGPDATCILTPRKLSTTHWAENARFEDPVTRITGLRRYMKAASLLFDISESKVDLLSCVVTAPRQITAKLPWRPVVAPVDGTSVFTVNDQGLISKKVDYWSTSPGEAVVETFLPGWGREKEAA